MNPTEIAKPLGVFVVVIGVVLAGTALLSVATGSEALGTPDGQHVQGQSPGSFQPENVNIDADPETGEISLDGSGESKRILVDSQHSNQFSRTSLEPVVEALSEAGHDVDFVSSGSGTGDFGSTGYNATLQAYDALLVIQPTTSFSSAERAGIQAYTEGGGRVLVLGEPTQVSGGGGVLSSASLTSFGANGLMQDYGAVMGAEALFNVDDAANDNNFKSIYASPSGGGSLTDGVDTVTFDTAGHLAATSDGDAEVFLTADEGTKTLETRRTGTYATAVRNGNLVFVADSDFVVGSEVYDADNEVFVSNLLEWLTSGDKPDDVPAASGTGTDDDF